MEKAIYKLDFSCGRQGNLTGVFVAPKAHVRVLVEEKIGVHFGEALGKHSEIYGSVFESEIEIVTDDPKVVEIFEEFGLDSGINPFYYPTSEFDFDLIDVPEGKDAEDMVVYEVIEALILQSYKDISEDS